MNKTKSLFFFVSINIFVNITSFAQNRILSDAGEGVIQRFDGLSMDSTKILLDLLTTTIGEAYTAFKEMETKPFSPDDVIYKQAFPKINPTDTLELEKDLKDLCFLTNKDNQVNGFALSFTKYRINKDSKSFLKVAHEPKAIYFSDGTIQTENISHLEVSATDIYGNIEPWPISKPIDSIAIDVTFSFPEEVDIVSINRNPKKVTYQSEDIILDDFTDSHFLLKTSKKLPPIAGCNGFSTKEEYIYPFQFLQIESIPPTTKSFKGFLAYAKDLKKKLDKNKFETTESFQAYAKKKALQVPFLSKDPNYEFYQLVFSGPIDYVDLYFTKTSFSKTITYMAKPYKK